MTIKARNYGDREWSNAPVEICAFGPKGTAPFGLYEHARVRVEQSGTAMAYLGFSPYGQGEETTFAQLVAEEFSIPVENVMIIHDDTNSTPEGCGTMAAVLHRLAAPLSIMLSSA